jgi:hypothetical protein
VLTGPIAGAVGAAKTVLGAGLIGGTLMAALIAVPTIRAFEAAERAQLNA